MDIQVSSNFERLLFELLDRDGMATAAVMKRFADTGQFKVDDIVLARARQLFSAYSLDDAGTLSEIAKTALHNNMTIDPHSAVGIYAARCAHDDGTVARDVPIVALACAHPAKFDTAVTRATGVVPLLPPHLADLMQRPERQEHVAATPDAIKSFIVNMKRDT
jgi:threonine synthase